MRKKGFFSKIDLSVASKYVYPRSRASILYIGAALTLLCVSILAYNFLFGQATLLTSGPLSPAHATLSNDCMHCHAEFSRVNDAQCAVCHEKYGDAVGIHTFRAHYLYRTDDYSRVFTRENEQNCAQCHREHQTQPASLLHVDDAACVVCHQFGTFNQNHPPFAFEQQIGGERAGINFNHIPHVQEIQHRKNIVDLEAACMQCHLPTADGAAFQAIDFDVNCSACHLLGAESTAWLPVKNTDRTPGVLTLDALKQNERAVYENIRPIDEGAFARRRRGQQIRKSAVTHKDAWILANLALLRREIYPGLGLADLLATTAADPLSTEKRALYDEALNKLQMAEKSLRAGAGPSLQSELSTIRQYLDDIASRLSDPTTVLDGSKWRLSPALENPDFSPKTIASYQILISDLTQPCQKCHFIKYASLVRVQKDQRILQRAEFNHRTHIIQQSCFECHNEIRFPEFGQNADSLAQATDVATTQNVPGIEKCQTCHKSDAVSNRCITCHRFHPN